MCSGQRIRSCSPGTVPRLIRPQPFLPKIFQLVNICSVYSCLRDIMRVVVKKRSFSAAFLEEYRCAASACVAAMEQVWGYSRWCLQDPEPRFDLERVHFKGITVWEKRHLLGRFQTPEWA